MNTSESVANCYDNVSGPSESVANCYTILSGPNKSTLFDAYQYAYSKDKKITVNFNIPQGYLNRSNNATDNAAKAYLPLPLKISNVTVTGLQYEDGSGESFNLEGYCNADIDYYRRNDGARRYKCYRFLAYYNTKNRTGWFALTTYERKDFLH